MTIDEEKLKLALSTLQKGNIDPVEKIICPSMFVKLCAHMINCRLDANFPQIATYIDSISVDLSNIETITSRLAWEKELWKGERISVGQWMNYAQCDIDLFHVEMRSIFDYIARVVKIVSKHPQGIPQSFNDLRKWLKKPENTLKVGEDLAKLILSADWFEQLKNVRDVNIHFGGMTLVFLEKDRILFQTYKGNYNLISIPELMYNENVADFELYAGMYFGYLIAFLEEFSEIVKNRLPKGKMTFGAGNARKAYQRIPDIYLWMDKLVYG
ncbi:MAG: hypothetical protein M1490_04975 [Candidatus Bathyarchaeota archaeon]|nr:hypothetical protein [Candidatus Bathyarchaeota archaeon]